MPSQTSVGTVIDWVTKQSDLLWWICVIYNQTVWTSSVSMRAKVDQSEKGAQYLTYRIMCRQIETSPPTLSTTPCGERPGFRIDSKNSTLWATLLKFRMYTCLCNSTYKRYMLDVTQCMITMKGWNLLSGSIQTAKSCGCTCSPMVLSVSKVTR